MELSIIIPYHNEGPEFISETLRSIYDTIDVKNYEIIVVDDCSDIPPRLSGKEKVIRHTENIGVGAAFDTGVKSAQSDNLFLMGSDIRFIKNNWASRMIKEINDHPKSFTCTTCVIINKSRMDIKSRITEKKYCMGATILMFHDNTTNPRKSKEFRSIIEAQWLPVTRSLQEDSFEIPCILGAAYGVLKKWYNYVDGWTGHYHWGTLEPYISLKSWMFGGTCRCAPQIITGHIFKPHGTHGTSRAAMVYNKMLVSSVLLPDQERLIAFFKDSEELEGGREIFEKRRKFVEEKRDEYSKKVVFTIEQFCKRWNINYRDEREN